jgi:2-alkyl-3-oxoalkanoate reductase
MELPECSPAGTVESIQFGLTMALALVTGGTGFVGGHVARVLENAGWKVRLLARDPQRARTGLLKGLDCDVVAGDLSDSSVLERAASGAAAVVHVAGLLKARSLYAYREVNVLGTERLIAAASKTSPDSVFVLVSSQAAAGPALDGRPVNDGDPARPVSWYGLSKREGEEALARNWKGPWIVLRPAVVYGPGDPGLLTYFRLAASGFLPVPAAKSRIQIVGVDQVSLAIARAASRRDLAGKTGFLADPEPIRLADLARLVAGATGTKPRVVSVPGLAVRLLGVGETAVEALTRRSRPFNADKARELLAGDWLCDGGPMRRALELPEPVGLAEGLRATAEWYRRAGWL